MAPARRGHSTPRALPCARAPFSAGLARPYPPWSAAQAAQESLATHSPRRPPHERSQDEDSPFGPHRHGGRPRRQRLLGLALPSHGRHASALTLTLTLTITLPLHRHRSPLTAHHSPFTLTLTLTLTLALTLTRPPRLRSRSSPSARVSPPVSSPPPEPSLSAATSTRATSPVPDSTPRATGTLARFRATTTLVDRDLAIALFLATTT